jgi:hypothetical protein
MQMNLDDLHRLSLTVLDLLCETIVSLTRSFFITQQLLLPNSRVDVMTMAGGAITIHDASAIDTILSVKERVFAVNRKMSVRRQRLVYSAGPHGMKPLANTKTLSGAGVAQDGSAKLDVLLVDLTAAELQKLNEQVLNAVALEYARHVVLIIWQTGL